MDAYDPMGLRVTAKEILSRSDQLGRCVPVLDFGLRAKLAARLLALDVASEAWREAGLVPPGALQIATNAIWAVAGTTPDYADHHWVVERAQELVDLLSSPDSWTHPQVTAALSRINKFVEAWISPWRPSLRWVNTETPDETPAPAVVETDSEKVDRPTETDHAPPGQVIASSPHPTNAPPRQFVAPLSVGELALAA